MSCGHRQIARHIRSFTPTDVGLGPGHARRLRQARGAHRRLNRRDPDTAPVDLARHDTIAGVM